MVIVGLAIDPLHAVGVSAALVVGAGAVVLLARRRLGGFTGDVLGAAGVVGETCALLAFVAHR
jgi:cobalamin synthase